MKNLLFSNSCAQHLDIKIEKPKDLKISANNDLLEGLTFLPIISNIKKKQVIISFISRIKVSIGNVSTKFTDIDKRPFSKKKYKLRIAINKSDTLDTYHKYSFTLDANELKKNKLFSKFLNRQNKGYKFLEIVFCHGLNEKSIGGIMTDKVGKAVVSNKDFEDDDNNPSNLLKHLCEDE